MDFDTKTERVIAALARVAELWDGRLSGVWTPPAASLFPWAQVQLSLAALLPGMREAREWVIRCAPPAPIYGGREGAFNSLFSVTLILAGNTPLLSWSPLCACLLAGATRIRVKMSREETVWTPLFVETLAEADPELAARIELYDFPGEDERTYDLLQDADAVIAYGSDAAITALQTETPSGIPFFGYGHAVSMAYLQHPRSDYVGEMALASRVANDILLYDQQGCLSPHIIAIDSAGSVDTLWFAYRLDYQLKKQAEILAIAPVTDITIATAIRETRDLALFAGHFILGDDGLCWTIIVTKNPIPYPAPVGHGVVYLSPVESLVQFAELLAPVRGIVSCAGVAGDLPEEWETVLREAGVSRICAPGEMQTPPLDWPNGNRDLLAELWKLRKG